MSLRSIVGLLSVLFLAACSSVEEGATCEGDTGECDSGTAALICDRGTYRLFQCRGTGGCLKDEDKNTVICLFGNFRSGDNCPQNVEGGAQCDATNANQALVCKSGVMQTQACKGCAFDGTNITCQP